MDRWQKANARAWNQRSEVPGFRESTMCPALDKSVQNSSLLEDVGNRLALRGGAAGEQRMKQWDSHGQEQEMEDAEPSKKRNKRLSIDLGELICGEERKPTTQKEDDLSEKQIENKSLLTHSNRQQKLSEDTVTNNTLDPDIREGEKHA